VIDPDFLDELDRFDARLRRRVGNIFAGEQATQTVGEGRTFSDYRRYVRGDDTRLVDWKLYGRTRELYVRQFETERNLTMHLLVDASGSMDFGPGATNKFEYAAKLALGFAYLAVEENNDFRFVLLDEEPRRIDADRSNRGEVLELVDRCNEVEPAGEGDLGAALTDYAASVRTRSLLLVASDFLADPEAVEQGLAALARNDLTLAQTFTPAELDPPVHGDTVFEEPETGTEHRTYFGGRLRESYRSRLQGHVDAIAARADAAGARHVLVDTGADFFETFLDVWPE
jgi:uncharacterized protein (DUF58 family)